MFLVVVGYRRAPPTVGDATPYAGGSGLYMNADRTQASGDQLRKPPTHSFPSWFWVSVLSERQESKLEHPRSHLPSPAAGFLKCGFEDRKHHVNVPRIDHIKKDEARLYQRLLLWST